MNISGHHLQMLAAMTALSAPVIGFVAFASLGGAACAQTKGSVKQIDLRVVEDELKAVVRALDAIKASKPIDLAPVEKQLGEIHRSIEAASAADNIDISPLHEQLKAIQQSLAERETRSQVEAARQHDFEDLQAQKDMAAWAGRLFWATLGSLVLTAVGLMLLWRTLIHTRDAAVAASRGVDEANKANRLAEQSAAAAMRAADADRGFILVDAQINWNMRDKPSRSVVWWPRMSIRHLGRSPVIVWSIEHELVALPIGLEPDDKPIDERVEYPNGYVLSEGRSTVEDGQGRPRMDGSEFDEEITTGKKVMWYRGAVNYEDIHGTPRVTRFRCILDSDLKTTVPRGGKPFNERT